MTETLFFISILALIVVNSRREVWKHRAKMRQVVIEELNRRIELERDANIELSKQLPGVRTLYRPTTEWPEDIDA